MSTTSTTSTISSETFTYDIWELSEDQQRRMKRVVMRGGECAIVPTRNDRNFRLAVIAPDGYWFGMTECNSFNVDKIADARKEIAEDVLEPDPNVEDPTDEDPTTTTTTYPEPTEWMTAIVGVRMADLPDGSVLLERLDRERIIVARTREGWVQRMADGREQLLPGPTFADVAIAFRGQRR